MTLLESYIETALLPLKIFFPRNPITSSLHCTQIPARFGMIWNSDNLCVNILSQKCPLSQLQMGLEQDFSELSFHSSSTHSYHQETQENVALPACCHTTSGSDLITRKTPGSAVHSFGDNLPSLAVLNQC